MQFSDFTLLQLAVIDFDCILKFYLNKVVLDFVGFF